MFFEGVVKDGVIVAPPGVHLPEGAKVTVEILSESSESPDTDATPKDADDEIDPIWRMAELAMDTGIPDLAVNIDHYLYGHPKVTDSDAP